MLTVSSIFVIFQAIGRIAEPQPVDSSGMLWLALVGIAVNGAAALRLKHGGSLSERAVFLHIMEDVLGWVAVLVVSIVMMFVDLPVLDPILSIAISLWVLWNVYGNIRATFRILLQAIPQGVDTAALEAQIVSLPSVESLHDVHLWTLDGDSHIMTLHVVCDTEQGAQIKRSVIEIARNHGIDHVTVEIEPSGSDCLHSCD